ncbi:MAG TPA: hypothetical protein VGB23_07150, partial [Nitrospirota bacterium]
FLHRNEIKPAPKNKTLVFFFAENKQLHFDDDDYGHFITEPNQKIEGNIWAAGCEKDAIILGVSFDTNNQVLINTLHIAYINQDTEDEIAGGIIIRTSVFKNRQ